MLDAFFFELITSQCICASGAICCLILAETDLGVPQQRTTQPGSWLSRTHAAMHTSLRKAQVLLCTTNEDHGCLGRALTWRIFLYLFPRLLSPPHKLWKTSMGLANPFYCPIYKIYKNKANTVQRVWSRFTVNATGNGLLERKWAPGINIINVIPLISDKWDFAFLALGKSVAMR